MTRIALIHRLNELQRIVADEGGEITQAKVDACLEYHSRSTIHPWKTTVCITPENRIIYRVFLSNGTQLDAREF